LPHDVPKSNEAIELFKSATCFLLISENTQHQAQPGLLGTFLHGIKLSCTRDEEELEKVCKIHKPPVLPEIDVG